MGSMAWRRQLFQLGGVAGCIIISFFFHGFGRLWRSAVSLYRAGDEARSNRVRDVNPAMTRGRQPKIYRLKSCEILWREGATYSLEQDVSATGTCFSIQANNVTLDLNGHKITYATASNQQPRYGILAEACWDTGLAGNPCGGAADRLTVQNGSILQGSGAAPYSHAIRIGQINGTDHLTVREVTFEISASSSVAIFTTSSGAGSSVLNNQIRSHVDSVNNRHQIEGASIKFANEQRSRAGQSIHDNMITGGAQGGIFSASPETEFYNNTISQNGRYSNDFGIYAWGNKSTVRNNTIAPTSGRGIQIAGGTISINGQGAGSNGVAVYQNTINVIELRQNCDHSEGQRACDVCQPGGAYGIQFDDNPSNGVAYQNEVTARADECDAQALRLTDVGKGNNTHDNVFVAQKVSEKQGRAWALGTGGAPNHFLSTHDTYIADTANFHADWDGMPGGFTCIRCTLVKGATAAPNYASFSFENGGRAAIGIHFQDTAFKGDADKDSTDMRAIGPTRKYAEYFIDWTYSLTVKDSLGDPVRQGMITIKDATDALVFTGPTDDKGQVSVVLNEFRKFNTQTGIRKEMRTPHTVSLASPTCEPRESMFSVKIERPTQQTFVLNCASPQKPP